MVTSAHVAAIGARESAKAAIDYGYGRAQPEHQRDHWRRSSPHIRSRKGLHSFPTSQVEGNAAGLNPVPDIEL